MSRPRAPWAVVAAATLSLSALLAACAPAAPSPTAPPPRPTEAPKPAAKSTDAPRPTDKPVEKPAARPAAPSVEEFYKGKTVRFIVGFAPGGGFDTYTRLIARHIGRFIPGNPTVIVENMEGASSRVAANHAYNVAPKDGTVIVNFHGNLFMQQVFGARGIEFEGDKFGFLGVPARDRNLCVASEKSGFKSLQEVQKPAQRQIILAADSPGSTTYDVAAVLTEALDLNTKIVQGYRGTAPGRLAIEQGEVDGMCGWSWESAKTSNFDDFASGKLVPIVQVADKPIADMPSRSPAPLASALAKSDAARLLIKHGLEDLGSFNRPYLAPPGLPPERLQALRAAFMEALKSPALLEDAQKAKLDINPVGGEELEKLVKDTLAMPPAIRDRLKQILVP